MQMSFPQLLHVLGHRLGRQQHQEQDESLATSRTQLWKH